jgi:hypothetical protein
MPTLQRLLVWLVERLLEAFFLGCWAAYLLHLNWSASWVLPLVLVVLLFMHGYYFTTAFFGVVWRPSGWHYPAIMAAVFVIHGWICSARFAHDLSPETRSIELPFVLGGACLASAFSFAGERVLNRWRRTGASQNPHLSAIVITLFVFALVNTAHFMRVTYSDSFRLEGIPFSLYREGGFSDGFVWHSGKILWRGVIADAVLLAGICVLLAKSQQRFAASRTHR